MEKKIITKVWGIGDVESIKKINSFSNEVNIIRTCDNKYILKAQNNINKIHQEVSLLSSLKNKVPVAIPVMAKNKKYYYKYKKVYYVLYPFLEGKSFTDFYINDSYKKADLLGKAIGDLHYFLKNIKFAEYKTMNLIHEVLQTKNVIKNNNDLFDWNFLKRIINSYTIEMNNLYEYLPKQIIHRDLHPDNILYIENKLSGIIDFELSVVGLRIYDPCYCATSMLVSNFNDEDKRVKWIKVFKVLLEGYKKKIKINKEEVKSLMNVLYAIQFAFITFSFSTDNIEAAKYNEKVLKWLYKNRRIIMKAISTIA